jgi:tRNA-Thr(GGU) m(6)t(6)A37 methyltransferase TsaA
MKEPLESQGDSIMGVSVQVSLYPLGQASLSPAINEALKVFRERGLDVEPGAMSSLLVGEDRAVFGALHEAFRRAAEHGPVVMVATFSNACPVPSESEESKTATYRAIGHVENDFDGSTAPGFRSFESRLVLEPNLTEGLKGLEAGHQIMVIFHLHRAQGYDLLQHPRGDRSRLRRGVFALRSPRRPNPIGITVVDLVAVEGTVLRVKGLDAINGTPVLDLKPV